MGLRAETSTRQHVSGSTVQFLLSLISNTTFLPVTAQSPTIAIRRGSDGFFFNGTVFVSTAGVPTNLAMTEISATSAAGLYLFSFVDPGLVAPLTVDTYQLRYVNTGTPAGEIWDIREFRKALRDFNTQGI